jgi:hypothetical protein
MFHQDDAGMQVEKDSDKAGDTVIKELLLKLISQMAALALELEAIVHTQIKLLAFVAHAPVSLTLPQRSAMLAPSETMGAVDQDEVSRGIGTSPTGLPVPGVSPKAVRGAMRGEFVNSPIFCPITTGGGHPLKVTH